LNLTIVNVSNNSVSNAQVYLYKTKTDLANTTNAQDVQVSDNNGSVTFQNLGPNVYYFNVYRPSDCSTNIFTANSTGTLNSGQTNKQTVTVNQIGQETFKNTSGTDNYNITINSTPFQTVNANASVTANMIVGTYTIHITPATTGTAKDVVISVTSCQTSTLSFP